MLSIKLFNHTQLWANVKYRKNNMLSSSREGILAYRYQAHHSSLDRTLNLSLRSQKIEYFIPSRNICINKENIYKSNRPNNLDSCEYHCPTVLQKCLLPKTFIDKVYDELHDKNYTYIDDAEINNILSNLFKNTLYERELSLNEQNFEKDYIKYGNLALPHYIFRYFNDDNLSKNSTVTKKIFRIIASLDDMEKSSLENHLRGMMKEQAIRYTTYNVKESSCSLSDGIIPLGVGIGLTCLAESIPAGLIGAGLTLFGKYKYNKSLENQNREFQENIFTALSTEPLIFEVDSKPYRSRG